MKTISAPLRPSARALREMAVITDVNTNARITGFKSGKSQVAGSEIEFLPESGEAMWDMSLTVLSQILAVRIDNCRSIVIDPGHLFFVNRSDNHHAMLSGNLAHKSGRWSIRYWFN